MAYNYYGKRNYSRGKGKYSYSNQMTRFAYHMGCVQRGLQNPDSKITASYNAGATHVESPKKTLY
jgi:hypothetical protein